MGKIFAGLKRNAEPMIIGSALMVSSMGARAEFDFSGVTAAGVTVAAVGAAVFLVAVAIKVVKWVIRVL